MKFRYKIIFGIVSMAALAAIFTGCRPTSVDLLSDEDIQGLKDYVVSSYYILKGDEDLSESRATIPVHNIENQTFTSGSRTYYPEVGQTTTWEVENRGDNLYRITAVTQYASNDAVDYTEEIYYVKDIEPDGIWTIDDPTVDSSGNSDYLYREKFITVFKDGSIRYEKIINNSLADETQKYAAFEWSNVQKFPESEAAFLTLFEDAFYSSKVSYQQDVYKRFAFWNVLNKQVIGTRYYTETGDDGQYPYRTSVSYERTIERKSRSRGGFVRDLMEALYEPDTLDIDNATLAETVIWYEIDTDGTPKIKQKSKIVNDFSDDPFYLTAEGGEVTVSSTP